MKKQTEEETQTSYFQTNTAKTFVIAAVLAFAGTCAFPYMCQISGESLALTNSFWSVVIFLVLFFVLTRAFQINLKKIPEENKHVHKGWIWPSIAGTLFSGCMIFGSRLEMEESIPFRDTRMWLAIVAEAAVFSILIRFAWDKLSIYLEKRPVKVEETQKERKTHIPSWLLTGGVIFLCYLPVFLAVFPGFFVYDAQDEYMQVVTRNFSTHHPLIHVLLLGGIIQLVYKLTASYNAGIACYVILQMLILSGIFGWSISKLRKRGLSKVGHALITLYFGICPVLVMFSLCSAKDGYFTGMLLIMVILLQELCHDPESFLKRRAEQLLLVLASAGMMLLRHNGFYAFLVFVPILLIFLRKYWKKVLLLPVATIVFYIAVNCGLSTALHADASEHQEILTVPIMQLTRVYAYEKENMAPEDIENLLKFLPEEALNRYNPKVSDSVKIDFQNAYYEDHKKDFQDLWFRNGRNHPFAYANAWFMTSYGFWYPDTVIDTYRGNTVFTYTYGDSSYFGYEVEQPGTRKSLNPWLNELYRRLSLEITQQKIPVMSMLFSPGFLLWVNLFVLGFYCYSRKWNRLIPMLLPLLCFLTVLLGPACLVRYVVFWWAMLPLLICDLLRR